MTDILLHHYDGSPYSEKIRLILGYKGLGWKSVVIPMILPKPDLMPLTGGYRRTPVLQLGADVYCDTALIGDEIERRWPAPTLYPRGGFGASAIVAAWAEKSLFWRAAGFAMGMIADKLPAEFHADRAAMRGAPAPSVERLKAAAPRSFTQVRPQLAWLEQSLDDGRAFLLGEAPALADFSVYHCLWFLTRSGRRVSAVLEPYPRISAWMARLAAFGHGDREELGPEAALEIALAAEPEAAPSITMPGAPEAGSAVAVAPDDYGKDPVVGDLVIYDDREIAVRRDDARVGAVVVHFPAVGYTVKPA